MPGTLHAVVQPSVLSVLASSQSSSGSTLPSVAQLVDRDHAVAAVGVAARLRPVEVLERDLEVRAALVALGLEPSTCRPCRGKRFEAGLHRVGGTALYVSRGIGMDGGTAPGVRFWARPEVAVIDLVAQ